LQRDGREERGFGDAQILVKGKHERGGEAGSIPPSLKKEKLKKEATNYAGPVSEKKMKNLGKAARRWNPRNVRARRPSLSTRHGKQRNYACKDPDPEDLVTSTRRGLMNALQKRGDTPPE